jgi:hypothetical protein
MGLKVKEAGVFIDVGGGGTTLVGGWVRNPAWPALPAVTAGEQKIVGLYAVWPGDGTGNGGNFFAFNATGAYTINYGDGSTTNYASNTQANYEFSFNDSGLAGTDCPVTFTASTSRVNRTAHGHQAGAKTQFYNILTTTGLSEGQSYYVINPTADSFQVSTTPGGSPVTLTNNGSATLLPYKVALVTITPQAGQNLTVVNFLAKNNQAGLQTYATGWLDLAISVPNVSGTGFTLGGTAVAHRHLEKVDLIAYGALTTMAGMFQNCSSLQAIPALPGSVAAVTNMSNMFNSCYSLQAIPALPGSVAAVTNMAGMFQNCSSLQAIPALPGSVAAVTNMTSMFQNCSSLRTIPALPGSVAAVTNMSNMFNSCLSLRTIPGFPGSVAAVTNMTNMFNSCHSLQAIPAMSMSGVSSSGGATAFVSSLPQLARIPVTGMRFSFSVASCKLSAVALNEIFTGLPTVTGQIITVTGNYGISQSGYDPTIATAKGWTVTA